MKRMNQFVYALLIGCVLLTGCGSNTNTTETKEEVISDSQANASTEATQSESASEEENDSVTGRIESIDETSITLAVMNMPGGAAPDGNGGGDKPSVEAPDGNGGGDKPSGEAPDGNGGGDKPSGEAPDGNGGGDKPSGDGNGAPQAPDNNAESVTITLTDNTLFYDESGSAITIDSLTEGTTVTVATDADGNAISVTITTLSAMGGGMGGGQSAPSSYEAVNTYSEDNSISNESISSTGTDENAILVTNQANVSLDNVTIDRTSSDSTGGDSSSFYGVGAAVLATDGTVNISNSTITTNASGGAGIFAYGDGVANVSDTTINTTQDTSGGIHVAGGGTLHATNLTVETNGGSAATIRSDRGGGTMTVNGGSYTSNGSGSPAVYCTADIDIQNATLTATGSEAVCIEGLNSLKLTDCDLTGDMPENEQNDCTWTVILYQSMSGDSEVGNSTFSMTGGSLTSKNGGLFYTTNTESTFYLSDVDITYSDSNDFFLKCTGNSNARGWGQSGANGADCIFTADNQDMTGDVIWDSISDLDFDMVNGSTLIGAFVQDESNAGNGGNGYANLTNYILPYTFS
ncbi:MAG: hypothetical protein BHW48_06715 [Roseburia sp. CAG:10041_57]|nr:MAG: hypothetical protein BHW48_06715 [Roseburia sp. CAG:10041_57]